MLASGSSSVEKLDALMWIDINVVLRYNDEYNIQLEWLRESPPSTADLGPILPARLRDLKALLSQGTRAGESRVPGRSAHVRAAALFDPIWMRENPVRKVGARAALTLGRDSVLRGSAVRA